ncbi:hypothetical protein GCM10009856_07450 [Mycolicibacterium llatzerense]
MFPGRTHDSSYLLEGPEGAICGQHRASPRDDFHRALPRQRPPTYRGSSPTRRCRGVLRAKPTGRKVHPRARIAPGWNPFTPTAAVVLELPDDVYAGVPCWNGKWARWAHLTVGIAYDLGYQRIRPLMCDGGISRKTLILVAAALARYADYRTGRNARPTNRRLAEDTALSERTVQRGREALRLLGLATELLRGRQRTRGERFASWRLGDRHRGWASVWCLHESAWQRRVFHNVSSHPRKGSLLSVKSSFRDKTTTPGTAGTPPAARRSGASRRRRQQEPSPGRTESRQQGYLLASSWLRNARTPQWARKHTPRGWSAILAPLAEHGWTPDDINELMADWERTGGNWLPPVPYKPIALIATMVVWHRRHNGLDNRPAALALAQEQAAEQARIEQRLRDRRAQDESRRARAVARDLLGGPAHRAALQVAADAAARATAKRGMQAAHDAAARAELVARQRGQAQPGCTD